MPTESGTRGSRGRPTGSQGVKGASMGSLCAIGLVWWDFWWSIRHVCLYIWTQEKLLRVDGTGGESKVLQEVLADLKSVKLALKGLKLAPVPKEGSANILLSTITVPKETLIFDYTCVSRFMTLRQTSQTFQQSPTHFCCPSHLGRSETLTVKTSGLLNINLFNWTPSYHRVLI